MTAKDRPQSRPATPEFLSNYDRIFRKPTQEPAMPTTLLDGETYTDALSRRMQEEAAYDLNLAAATDFEDPEPPTKLFLPEDFRKD